MRTGNGVGINWFELQRQSFISEAPNVDRCSLESIILAFQAVPSRGTHFICVLSHKILWNRRSHKQCSNKQRSRENVRKRTLIIAFNSFSRRHWHHRSQVVDGPKKDGIRYSSLTCWSDGGGCGPPCLHLRYFKFMVQSNIATNVSNFCSSFFYKLQVLRLNFQNLFRALV